jgi:hypothetical protein
VTIISGRVELLLLVIGVVATDDEDSEAVEEEVGVELNKDNDEEGPFFNPSAS